MASVLLAQLRCDKEDCASRYPAVSRALSRSRSLA